MRFNTFVLSALLTASSLVVGQQATAKTLQEELSTEVNAVPQLAQAAPGTVEGRRVYGSDEMPEMRICAQLVSNLHLISCIDSTQPPTASAFPFRMRLAPGDYYMFSYEERYEEFFYHAPSMYAGIDSHPIVVRVRSGQTTTGVRLSNPSTCSIYPQYCIRPPARSANNSPTIRQQAQAKFAQAQTALNNGDYIAAAEAFGESIALMNQDPNGQSILSNIWNSTPIVGDIKGLFEAVLGEDILTGQQIETWERVLGGLPLDRQVSAIWNSVKTRLRGTSDVPIVRSPETGSGGGGSQNGSGSSGGGSGGNNNGDIPEAPRRPSPPANHAYNPSFPLEGAQLGHIFRNSPGHFPVDSPQNRRMILDTVADPDNFVGSLPTRRGDKYIYARTNPDGTQTWGEVLDGRVQNAGINPATQNRRWNQDTGRFESFEGEN